MKIVLTMIQILLVISLLTFETERMFLICLVEISLQLQDLTKNQFQVVFYANSEITFHVMMTDAYIRFHWQQGKRFWLVLMFRSNSAKFFAGECS